jgi:hypothetical protein
MPHLIITLGPAFFAALMHQSNTPHSLDMEYSRQPTMEQGARLSTHAP